MPEGASQARALSAAEFKTVEAMAGRIVPTTDTPGAVEAGAADYIDFALAGAYARHRETYRRGLAGLDGYCTATFGRSFAALPPERQDGILETLEAGRIEVLPEGAKFFELVLAHVMEGMFGEPQYGGNRGLVGWKLVGFPGQRYGYADSYINKPVDLEPVAWDGLPREDS